MLNNQILTSLKYMTHLQLILTPTTMVTLVVEGELSFGAKIGLIFGVGTVLLLDALGLVRVVLWRDQG
ncbi:hypothetical protein QBC45DRAFT_419462 [Copromyces sp. CBS 386.78]|nr:hypothetical protein QBC45DRAFT_419462 [Copromyces sp. CBS 386.78]